MDYYNEYAGAYVFALRFMTCGEVLWDKRMEGIVMDIAALYELYDDSSWETLEWLISLRFAWLCLDMGEDAINAIDIPSRLLAHLISCAERKKSITLHTPVHNRWEDCVYEIDGVKIESEGHETLEVWLNEKYLDESNPVKAGQTVFDLGAYKGESALWYSSKVSKSGQVYACEMIPENINVIRRNIERNNLDSQIQIVPYAIGTISKGYYNDRINMSGYVLEPSGSHSVETISIDELMVKNSMGHVDWIKMDIEGGECDALASATKTINRDKPSLAIAAYHSLFDLKKIAEAVLSINERYELFISHKVLSPIETTIFAHCKDK
jgi:FkbM family methyltransferase